MSIDQDAHPSSHSSPTPKLIHTWSFFIFHWDTIKRLSAMSTLFISGMVLCAGGMLHPDSASLCSHIKLHHPLLKYKQRVSKNFLALAEVHSSNHSISVGLCVQPAESVNNTHVLRMTLPSSLKFGALRMHMAVTEATRGCRAIALLAGLPSYIF